MPEIALAPLLDLPALRVRLLDQLLLPFGLLMAATVALSVYRHLAIAWNPMVLLHLVVLALFWLMILGRRRIPYRVKAPLLVLALWGLAINGTAMVGPVGNAKALFIVVVLMAMLFLSERAGWINVAAGGLILAAIGAAASQGTLSFDIDYPHYVRKPIVWVQTVFLMTIYSALAAFIAARLLHSLNATVAALHARTAELSATQDRLREALKRQRAILSNSSAGIAVIDGARRIAEVNPRFCAMLGYPPEALVGQPTRLLYPDPGDYESIGARFYAPLGQQSAYSEDIQVRRRDGSRLWTHASLSAMDAGTPQAGAVLVLVDIDRRKAAELDLQAAKQQAESANQAKSRFLASVTHELRTPLHAILGFAALLDRPGSDPADSSGQPDRHRRELIETIQRNGRTLLALINDVLDLARIESGRLDLDVQPTPLHALLRECIDGFWHAAEVKGLDLRLELGAGLPRTVLLDGRRVTQILSNLLGNAVKLTERGTVRLHAQARPRPVQSEATAGEPLELRLVVADTGPGIALADQARIFGSFVQSGPDTGQGSGLGLAIGRRLAERMGGRIDLDSAPGHGSRFTLVLPVRALAPPDGAGDGEARGSDCQRPLAATRLPPGLAAALWYQVGVGLGAASAVEGETLRALAARTTALAHAWSHAPLAEWAVQALPLAENGSAAACARHLGSLRSWLLEPPPKAALAELYAAAELGRSTRIEDWCRDWSGPDGRSDFAGQVLRLAHAFEHARILALVDAFMEGGADEGSDG